MKKLAVILAGAALLMTATSALATSYPSAPLDPGQLQGVLDGITVGGKSSVNVSTGMIKDGGDAYWRLTASGGSVATMVVELGSYAPSNYLYVYDSSNRSNMVQLFNGSNVQGDQVTLQIKADGTVNVYGANTAAGKFASSDFGYALISPDGTFYSDSKLNELVGTQNADHMLAYQGNNKDQIKIPGYNAGTWKDDEYILAFEDLFGTRADFNYTDMVVMVESVEPVPEPGTILLLGGGLIGLALYGRRRMKA